MNETAPGPLLAAIARQAVDLRDRATELRRAAASDDVSTTDRARVLLLLADATGQLDELLDRLRAATDILTDPAA